MLTVLPDWFSVLPMPELVALKNYRVARGLTQDALAKELGVHSITVSRWETGARSIDPDLVSFVAEKTGIAPGDLRPDLATILNPADRQ